MPASVGGGRRPGAPARGAGAAGAAGAGAGAGGAAGSAGARRLLGPHRGRVDDPSAAAATAVTSRFAIW